jgi:hypothetical protein
MKGPVSRGTSKVSGNTGGSTHPGSIVGLSAVGNTGTLAVPRDRLESFNGFGGNVVPACSMGATGGGGALPACQSAAKTAETMTRPSSPKLIFMV